MIVVVSSEILFLNFLFVDLGRSFCVFLSLRILVLDLAPNFIRQDGHVTVMTGNKLLSAVNLPSHLLLIEIVEEDSRIPRCN